MIPVMMHKPELSAMQSLVGTISNSATVLEQCRYTRTVNGETNGATKSDDPDSTYKQQRSQEAARAEMLDACRSLIRLVTGPVESLKNMVLIDKHDLVSLQVINHFGIADIVPAEGDMALADIASACALPVGALGRILRHAMTYRVFSEPRQGYIAHTEMSREIPRLSPFILYQLEICLPSALGLLEWLKQGEGKAKTPFQVAHRTEDSWWTYAEKRASLTEQYGKCMALITKGGLLDVGHVVSGYAWDKLGRALVVDVGGADGLVGVTLATAYSHLSVVVQDSIKMKESADARISADLKQRVVFVPHSFFDPQQALGSCADVFLLRHILHDWDDEACVTILQNLASSMKPGARIIVAELILTQSGSVSGEKDRIMRALDMQMMVQFGGKERTLDEWEALFALADDSLEIMSCFQPNGSADSFMELRKRQ